jgi:DnaK suppressor protein
LQFTRSPEIRKSRIRRRTELRQQRIEHSMRSGKRNFAVKSRYEQFRVRLAHEESELVLILRDAEEQLRRLNSDAIGDQSEFGAQRDVLAEKTNYCRHNLKLIRESLDRICTGDFGVCLSCGEEINNRRLHAVPTARFCLECQEQYENGRLQTHQFVTGRNGWTASEAGTGTRASKS